MCEPATLMLIAGATMLAGGGMSMYGDAQAADANEAMAEYQQKIAENNAEMAARHAANIERQADQKRNALGLQMQQRIGTARTQYASQGVVLGSGIVLDYEADIANAYDLDLKNLNYDVAMEAWQTKVQGVNFMNQAKMYHAQGNMYEKQKTSSIISGSLNMVGNLAMMGATPAGQAGLDKLGLGGGAGGAAGGVGAGA